MAQKLTLKICEIGKAAFGGGLRGGGIRLGKKTPSLRPRSRMCEAAGWCGRKLRVIAASTTTTSSYRRHSSTKSTY